MKPVRSIRRRLLVLLLVPLSFIVILEAIETFVRARATADELYDKTLLAVLLTMRENVLASNGDLLSENILEALTERLEDRFFYHVVGPDNMFVTGYTGFPTQVPTTANRDGIPVFFNSQYKGEPVRVASFRQFVTERDFNGWVTTTVWQSIGSREAFSYRLFVETLLRLGLLVISAGLIVWFAIRSGLYPLQDLRDAVAKRSSSDLSPIRRPVPIEVKSLVSSMNVLFSKVQDSIDVRERFIADAAHQLRNPIAGLKAHAEVAERAKTHDESHTNIKSIIALCDRMGRLLHQLLFSAKINSARGMVDATQTLDLVETVQVVARQFVAEAVKQKKMIEFHADDEKVMAIANQTLFEEVISNLIDNALTHNPVDTTVSLRVLSECGRAAVYVEDDGVGIPDEMLDKILAPFVTGSECASSSGLGLAIVNDAVRAMNGTLRLARASNGKGLSSRITLRHA